MRKIAVVLLTLSLLLLSAAIILSPFVSPRTADAPLPKAERLTTPSSPIISLPPVKMPQGEPSGESPFESRQRPTFSLLEKETAMTLEGNIRADKIEEYLRYLTKRIGARELGGNGNYAARQYLLNTLRTFGFSENNDTLARQGLYAFGLYTENIVAVLPAKIENPKIIVLSAHFDTVSRVEGAVDNASGVALLLELIRVLTESDLQFDFELRFCFFSAEENGYYGAYKYINLQSEDSIARHAAVFNIDMAGYCDTKTPKVFVVSTKAQPSVNGSKPAKKNLISNSIEKAYHMYEMNTEQLFSPTAIGKHDIVPFYKNGIPCATLSWRESEPSVSADNPFGIISPLYMHTPADSFDNLNINSIVTTTKLSLAAFSILGEHITSG